MIKKQNDPISKEKKVNIRLINYAELNKLSEHFEKHFVPQKELSAEQAFWLPISNLISEKLVVQPIPVKTEVPRELPMKELFLENDQLLELIISQDLVHNVVNSLDAIVDYQKMEKSFLDEFNKCIELKTELLKKQNMIEQADAPEFKEFFEINNLKAQLKGNDMTINKLKKHIANLKGKDVMNKPAVLAPGMFMLDLQPLPPTLWKNKEAHVDYLKLTKEHTDTMRGIVEQA
ncbi:hypothetical protein Tco_1320254 [Tanacetum coccineum]